jgi:hypothetical protein
MVQTVLVGSLLFGLLLVGIAAYLSGHGWRRYAPLLERTDGRSDLRRALDSPVVWTLAFLAVAVAAGVAVVAFVAGEVSQGIQQMAGVFLVAGTVIGLTLYLFYGTFVSARNRGLKSSQAAAMGSWAIGLLFIVVVVLKLMGMF